MHFESLMGTRYACEASMATGVQQAHSEEFWLLLSCNPPVVILNISVRKLIIFSGSVSKYNSHPSGPKL